MDYLEFRFYKNGELVDSVSIAKLIDNKIIPQKENFINFINFFIEFFLHVNMQEVDKTIIDLDFKENSCKISAFKF